MDVTLVIVKSDGTRREFPLSKARTVLGRGSDCDLRIPLPSVSRRHCEIIIDDDEIMVRDSDSRNGTFLNGVRVEDTAIEESDLLTVGPVEFTVVVKKPEAASVQA